jgi:hypothetical protein
MIRSFLAVATGSAALFVWSGLSQRLPWGVSVVQNFSTASLSTSTDQTSSDFEPRNLIRKPNGFYTNDAFDEFFRESVSTLSPDRSFSWIVSISAERYRPMRYLAVEGLTQIGIAALLWLALIALRPLARRLKLRALALLALAGGLSSYGVMMNWWGLPMAYAGGMVLNLILGWCAAGLLIDVISQRPQPQP